MATQKLLNLIVTRVDGPIFKGEVLSVTIPGTEGEMTILADHEPLISPLKAGVITIRKEDGEETCEIHSGTLEVSNNQAVALI